MLIVGTTVQIRLCGQTQPYLVLKNFYECNMFVIYRCNEYNT